MCDKDRYRKISEENDSIPVFSKAWWLDAVAGPDNWKVLIVEEDGEVLGTMPYILRKRYGLNILTQPPLTRSLGPWINRSHSSLTRQYGFENKVLEKLVQKLPAFDDFSQCWNPQVENWLPFFWNGFHQTTRYTYQIDDLTNQDVIWSNFRSSVHREIRKAENRMNLTIREGSMGESMPIFRETFRRQNMEFPVSQELLETLDKACGSRNCRKILVAVSPDGQLHAAVFIVWDATCAYYLMGGAASQSRNSGAISLCLWESIKHASGTSSSFDFEGSMLQPVERFFRAFGGKRIPYFQITKTPSLLLRVVRAIRTA